VLVYTIIAGGAWHLDPRLPGLLGLRALLPASLEPSTPQAAMPSTELEYRAWRYMHGVAEGETELPGGGCALVHLPAGGWALVQLLAGGCALVQCADIGEN